MLDNELIRWLSGRIKFNHLVGMVWLKSHHSTEENRNADHLQRQNLELEDVHDALQEFTSEYPHTDTYDNWLQKENYIYVLRYGDSVYPPKHILSRAVRIPTSDFSGGDQANRVFQQLGFIIEKK